MKKAGVFVSIALLVCFAAALPGADAATARATVEKEVSKILVHLKDPNFKQLPKDEQIDKIRAIINTIFNYTELSKRTLGRGWRDFSPGQQKEFEQLFGKLLEENYADRVLAYTSEKIEFGRETELRKDKVEVESAIITADDKNIPIHYRMVLRDDKWQVYDVVIEGISLVQNYRSQFREILARDAPEVLLDKLRSKVRN